MAPLSGPGCSDEEPPPASAPHAVRLPVNVHHWDRISFLHWPYDPGAVQRLLPDGLRVAPWDGRAWVGVTPFHIRVRPFGVPVVLPGFAFPETNLRTYVVGPGNRGGVRFLRMEVPARWFVATLRLMGLPYVRQPMSLDLDGDRIRYRSDPGRSGAGGHDIIVRPAEPLDPPHGGPAERFLTARWGAFSSVGRRLLYTPVQHPPWRLHAADVERCDAAALFTSVGLPPPAGDPVVHWSPGVAVRVGRPRVVGRAGAASS